MAHNDEIAISVNNVSKDFKLPHQKNQSVKSMFTNMLSLGNKTFEMQHALKDISFEVKKGEFFGIVGRNGGGKSTLLKILAEIYQPTSGTIKITGKLVPFIELGVGFNPELTGRENVYLNGAMLGYSTTEMNERYDKIVTFSELQDFMDQKLKNYSSGMQVRLAFACATMSNADILLVDEVLAVGDADFQRKCYRYFSSLKKSKKTVVFISHDMAAIKEYCDRAILIDDGFVEPGSNTDDTIKHYYELFQPKNSNIHTSGKDRWGTQQAIYKNISAKIVGENLIIKSNIYAKQEINKLFYGMHILGADGKEVTAINNRMLDHPDIDTLEKDGQVSITWTVLNIFSDGEYTVALTMATDSVGIVDWFNDAAHFNIYRNRRSTTAVLPPINISIERE